MHIPNKSNSRCCVRQNAGSWSWSIKRRPLFYFQIDWFSRGCSENTPKKRGLSFSFEKMLWTIEEPSGSRCSNYLVGIALFQVHAPGPSPNLSSRMSVVSKTTFSCQTQAEHPVKSAFLESRNSCRLQSKQLPKLISAGLLRFLIQILKPIFLYAWKSYFNFQITSQFLERWRISTVVTSGCTLDGRLINKLELCDIARNLVYFFSWEFLKSVGKRYYLVRICEKHTKDVQII